MDRIDLVSKGVLNAFGKIKMDLEKGSDKGSAKVKKVMDEWKSGKLKSSSGDAVKDRKQAIAIALSEAGLSKGDNDNEAYEKHKHLFDDEENEMKKSMAYAPLSTTMDMNTLAAAFISTLMSVQQSATITHRYQQDRKISTHLALGDFYEGLDSMIDELMETYQGYYKTQLSVSSNGWRMDNPVEDINKFCDYIETNRNFCSISFIQNQIDNIVALVARTQYKLNFVQS